MDWEPLIPARRSIFRNQSCVPQQPMEPLDRRPPTVRGWHSVPDLRPPTERYKSSANSSRPSRSHNFQRQSYSENRRSVSNMKSLLPLQLQSSPQMPSVSAWIDDTIRETQSSNASNIRPPQKEIFVQDHVPWMQSPQQELFVDVSRLKYRETPVYSEAGSPALSRVYASDGEPCRKPREPETLWEESHMSDSRTGSESAMSSSEATSVDCATSDANSEESYIFDSDSIISPHDSYLSIKCQGEYVVERAWWKAARRLPPTFEEGVRLAAASKELIESQSSRCSSICSEDIYDALSTPLVPARVHVVNVPAESSQYPRRITSLPPINPNPSSTPTSASARRMTTLGGPLSSEKSIRNSSGHTPNAHAYPIKVPPPNPRQNLVRHSPPISQFEFPFKHSHPTTPPKSSSSASQSDNGFAQSIKHRKTRARGSEGSEIEYNVTDGIYAAIGGFPRDMLFLNSPCVVNIRRESLLSRRSQAVYARSSQSSAVRSASQRSQEEAYRECSASAIDVLSEYHTVDTPEPPEADLTSLKNIFPDTDDWWRSVLYAQLVAYNYLVDINKATSRQYGHIIPPEVASTMGAPAKVVITPSAGGNQAYAEAVEGLELCISRITNCMGGCSTALTGIGGSDALKKTDLTIVRALAEVVRSCEATNLQRL